jgi:hypothetical protein
MTGSKIFRKTQRKGAPIHHPLLAFDIENDPKTGKFINAAVYGYIRDHHGKEHQQNKYFTDQTEFTDYLMSLRKPKDKNIPTKIVLFNASYDFWFIEKITDDAKTLTSGTSIITGKLKNGIPIMDLTNLTRQGTLENWIKYLDMENKFGIKKESLDNLEARVKSDARATYELGNYLENFFVHEMGIPLKLTIASAARYLYSLNFFPKFNHIWFRSEEDAEKFNTYERKAYRGGRVECFVKGKEKIKSYDINSMYLSVMRDNVFPDPNTAKEINNPRQLPEQDLYIADIEVEVPKQYIGVLPTLDPKTGKLIFPTGTFRGHFASPELNYAIKECSVKVIKIHSVITYDSYPYFHEYAKFIWKKRKEYKDKGNKGMDILIKYLGNTLYGGFGQRNKESYMGKLNDFNLNDLITKTPPKISEIEGEKYITANGVEGEDSQHTFPCIPVFITSFARLVLLKALIANEDNIVYCDTDSVKVNNPVKGIKIGKELGEWDYEGEETIEFHKSKMYGDKCKGVPKRAVLEWEDEVRKIYSYDKPNKMKESFRRGLTPALWKKTIKEVSKIDDKRIWISEKVSIPPVVEFLTVP